MVMCPAAGVGSFGEGERVVAGLQQQAIGSGGVEGGERQWHKVGREGGGEAVGALWVGEVVGERATRGDEHGDQVGGDQGAQAIEEERVGKGGGERGFKESFKFVDDQQRAFGGVAIQPGEPAIERVVVGFWAFLELFAQVGEFCGGVGGQVGEQVAQGCAIETIGARDATLQVDADGQECGVAADGGGGEQVVDERGFADAPFADEVERAAFFQASDGKAQGVIAPEDGFLGTQRSPDDEGRATGACGGWCGRGRGDGCR